jgi:hypothetical protein
MAIATLAIAGCASSGYNDGYYQPQPGYAYQPGYYGQPYYGGGYSAFGYDSDFDDDFDRDSNRYFHPAHGITCDRARDVCFDRYGLSYDATKRYLGEREANRAVHKYDDKILFYSPKRGITCDRRQHFCSDADGFNEKWTDRIFGDNAASQPPAQGGNNGNFAIRPDKQHQQEEPWWMRSSKHSYSDDNDDDNVRVLPPVQIHPNRLVDNNPPPAVLLPQAQPQGAVNNDSPAADDANGFAYRPGTPKRVYQPSNNDGDDTSSGNVCPPKGCSNK